MLELIPLHDNKWELGRSYTNDGITVPKGFITDLASIPRVLWWLYSPSNGDYAGACLIHDYLYTLQYDRAMADRTLKRILKKEGNSLITVYAFYVAVRLFGGINYYIIK